MSALDLDISEPDDRTAANGTLTLSAERDGQFLESLERDCIRLFDELLAHAVPGPWGPSPVEGRFLHLREALLRAPGELRQFRRSFLAAGRLNFPDSPRPKVAPPARDDRNGLLRSRPEAPPR